MTRYTPLVKDMQKDLKKQGYHLSLEQTYQHLLKADFIDADGQPRAVMKVERRGELAGRTGRIEGGKVEVSPGGGRRVDTVLIS